MKPAPPVMRMLLGVNVSAEPFVCDIVQTYTYKGYSIRCKEEESCRLIFGIGCGKCGVLQPLARDA